MLSCFVSDASDVLPLYPVDQDGLTAWLDAQPARLSSWVKDMGFKAEAGAWCCLPGIKGGIEGVVIGWGDEPGLWTTGNLALALPPATIVSTRASTIWCRSTWVGPWTPIVSIGIAMASAKQRVCCCRMAT